MEIKYEVHTLKNARGEGNERNYVVLRQLTPLTEDEIAERIQDSCSLTKGDVKAVLTELRSLAVEQLQAGNRFFIPGIGWLSLATGLDKTAQEPNHKITGKDIHPKAIRFKAEKQLFDDVTRDMTFVKSDYSSKSVVYTEEDLWAKIDDYLHHHDYITNNILQQSFGLGKYVATKWLKLFVGQGKLRKSANGRNYIYLRG